MMWSILPGVGSRRARLLKHCQPGPLHDFYSHEFANKQLSAEDTSFAVLDLETTGLDLAQDHIISMGLIEIKNLGIHLNTSWHQIVQTRHDMPEDSTIIHHITDDKVATGVTLSEAMKVLLARLQGKVMIAHHANIELGFINKVCQSLYNEAFIIPTVDTQCLAERQIKRSQDHFKSGSLRLFNLRNDYGLPAYKAHNALSDALSTAELFLALLNDLYPRHDCRLKDLLTRNV